MSNNKEDTLNELTELPKYFCVQCPDNYKTNQLWINFINWCSDKFFKRFDGDCSGSYYGIKPSGINTFCSDSTHNTTLITLEQWDKIVNRKDEFVLPEKWCIKGYEEVAKYSNVHGWMPPYFESISSYHHYPSYNYKCTTSAVVKEGYTEITLDQFKTHVLKQNNNMKENQEIIGYKAPYDLFFNKITKGTVFRKQSDGTYKVDYMQTNHYNLPKEIVETWEPQYKPKYELPKINLYKGELNTGQIKYGCALFATDSLKDLYEDILSFNNPAKGLTGNYYGSNRDIKSITLDSNVTITLDQLKQIVDYINNNK